MSTIGGIDEDEHEIELRLDHALVKRFTVGGQFKGPDPGVLIAVPEDDIEGQKLHEYRLNADKELEVRVPVKAGTRLVAAAFSDTAPSPSIERSRGRAVWRDGRQLAGIDMLDISGPFDGQVPADTPSRRRIFVCRPTRQSQDEEAVRARRSSTHAGAARLPAAGDRRRRPAADGRSTAKGGRRARFRRGHRAGARSAAVVARVPAPRRSASRPAPGPAPSYRMSDLELASRLSFFLWKSIPDDELLDVGGARPAERSGRSSRSRSAACWPTGAPRGS